MKTELLIATAPDGMRSIVLQGTLPCSRTFLVQKNIRRFISCVLHYKSSYVEMLFPVQYVTDYGTLAITGNKGEHYSLFFCIKTQRHTREWSCDYGYLYVVFKHLLYCYDQLRAERGDAADYARSINAMANAVGSVTHPNCRSTFDFKS